MNRICWIARILGVILASFWLFSGIASGINERGEPWILESYIMAGMITAAVLVVLLAWWKEGIGGVATVLFGIVFSTFAYISAGHNKWLAVLLTGVPFLLVGTLFLLSWQRNREEL